MNKKALPIFGLMLLTTHQGGYAQVLSETPLRWANYAQIGSGLDEWTRQLDLPDNQPEAVLNELLDPRVVRLMAASRGLAEKQLATIKIAAEPGHSWINLYQVGKSAAAFNPLRKDLRAYVRARREGHTQAYLFAAITNRSSFSAIRDPDLLILATNESLFAASWARKTGSGTSTNKTGIETDRSEITTMVKGKEVTTVTVHVPKTDEFCRWVSHRIIDGEIAWDYFLRFKADGSLNYIDASKSDAKEYDPKYRKSIVEVEEQVTAEMKKRGDYGQFGLVHSFWALKKQKLGSKGIDWRSPKELNPNTSFD